MLGQLRLSLCLLLLLAFKNRWELRERVSSPVKTPLVDDPFRGYLVLHEKATVSHFLHRTSYELLFEAPNRLRDDDP